jgi:hypothetical protein
MQCFGFSDGVAKLTSEAILMLAMVARFEEHP